LKEKEHKGKKKTEKEAKKIFVQTKDGRVEQNKENEVLYLDDQQVAFFIKENDKDFCFSAVYASTSFLKRRTLWQKLSELQIQFDLPW
jgi:hypothetical protein